ncbi:hypothetical protein F4679DRAFT_27217 [Xylaria curta]|nr:hypothetical protein F4679DRAFT_27217 [Xylaria curta]
MDPSFRLAIIGPSSHAYDVHPSFNASSECTTYVMLRSLLVLRWNQLDDISLPLFDIASIFFVTMLLCSALARQASRANCPTKTSRLPFPSQAYPMYATAYSKDRTDGCVVRNVHFSYHLVWVEIRIPCIPFSLYLSLFYVMVWVVMSPKALVRNLECLLPHLALTTGTSAGECTLLPFFVACNFTCFTFPCWVSTCVTFSG